MAAFCSCFIFSSGTIFFFICLLCIVPTYTGRSEEALKSCKNNGTLIDFLSANSRYKTALCTIEKPLIFKLWEFEENNLLLQTMPIDLETGNYCRQVRRAIFSFVEPVSFKTKPSLVAVSSDVLQNILDIDCDSVTGCDSFLQFVSGNGLVKNSIPIAHRYGGHQFGDWSGQLGDGRAVLLGDYVNRKGQRWELQLKGSGKTPYSRHGDGRAVLRSSIREFLASEAMYYLGVPTSRAASLVVSKDLVWRDMFYDGHPTQEKAAVVLRVAKSWFRIGSLEILTEHGEIALLRKLVDFIIDQHFEDIKNDNNKYQKFFSKVVTMTADMIARWQSVGFTHGVCNTDNFSLLSITIDYGPFGFLDEYNTDFVPNSSDDEGRYSYINQPSIGFFNLEKLSQALSPILDRKIGQRELMRYGGIFNARFLEIYRRKFGLIGITKEDELLIKSFLRIMESSHADYTMTFRQLADLSMDHMNNNTLPRGLWALRKLTKHKNWFDWLRRYQERLERNGPSDTNESRRQRMNAMNPRYILRNWMAQSAIDKADLGDFTEVQKILNVLQRPFTEQAEAEAAGFASPPPPWAAKLRVSCSS